MALHFSHSANIIDSIPPQLLALCFVFACPASTFCMSGYTTLIFLWVIPRYILFVGLFPLPDCRDRKVIQTSLDLCHVTGSGVDTGQKKNETLKKGDP